jgi:pimeloyl-ACP methyl ester carboxylesterase
VRKPLIAAVLVCFAACSGGESNIAAVPTSTAAADPAPAATPSTTPTTTAPEPAPGVLVSSEPDGNAFRIRYLSTGVRGDLVEVTGAVYVPEGEPPAGGWPVLGWAHGTTGGGDSCAPSLSPDFAVAAGSFQNFLDAGFVVAATDYEGLGTPGAHPYLNGLSAARSVIDAVRAARALVPGTSTRWVTAGHSQGGHAVVFTAEEAPDYAPELDLLGAVAFAPASGLPIFASLDGSALSGFVALVLAGYVGSTDVDLATLLTPTGIESLDVVEEGCSEDVFRFVGSERLLLPDSTSGPNRALAAYLTANDAGQVRTDVPLLVLQGDTDQIVPAGLTTGAVARLCALGDTVELITYPGADHGSVLVAAAQDVGAWVLDRLGDRPAPTTC